MATTSTVSWTNFAEPLTLVNVGSEAICAMFDNILCFTDLKTKAISYYKAESVDMGLSMNTLTGHNKFAFVAFSEVVLMPSVHIIQYPQFTKYAVFRTQKIISFVDIRFNDYDLLLALSGYPNYTFCIWNFRTGQQLVQFDTFKVSQAKSVLCSFSYTPQIVQFSEWDREFLVWDICYTGTRVDLHEVSKVRLSQDFTYSNISCMCYGEDNSLYVVDNFASVFRLVVAEFYLKLQWSAIVYKAALAALTSFHIENHKQGLLIYSDEIIYYIHRKPNGWQCEWKLLISHPPGILYKCVSNINGEIYASAALGNLYHIEVVNETVKVNPLNTYNQNCIDFVILKGIRDECLLQLTTTDCVNALSLARYMQYSRIGISKANTIAAHNTGPYIMVGTANGKIHFLNYSNVREPFILNHIETEKSYAVGSMHMLDKIAVYRSIYNDFHLIEADFPHQIFRKIASFDSFGENVGIEQCFLAENNRIFIFINRDSSILIRHINVLCCYQWQPGNNHIERLEFNLPTVYRDVGILTVPVKNIVEFIAVRMESSILDYLNFKTDTNELVIVHSLKTNHLGYINGIVSSINFLTWGVDSTFLYYRAHRKSPRPYGICQSLQIKYRPRVVKKVLDCFNCKYIVYLYASGGVKVNRVPSVGVPVVENIFIDNPLVVIEPDSITIHKTVEADVIKQFSPEQLTARAKLLEDFKKVAHGVTDLINFDISVTGKTKNVFKKFCLNDKWLSQLNEETQKLCQAERNSLQAAIADQSRIRDWIKILITGLNTGITFKLRTIFTHFSLQNYGLRSKKNDKCDSLFDLYRFYELDFLESEDVEDVEKSDESEEDLSRASELVPKKKVNYLNVQGMAYDHIVCDELAMQDVDIVTCNRMYNQEYKIRILITDRLKTDFNKKFEEIRQIKYELMEAIVATNNTLTKIYSNINCMLQLLDKPEMIPPPLSVPEWQKDEFVKSIMEVDDSEIKAVNRRKKKDEAKVEKHGRYLLWSTEFWIRSLITMMDGVLEKLWEEEIKKEIPMPEFLSKKEPGEYTLEDQRALRDYTEKCRILEEDRKKYLRILTENEALANNLKNNYILKLNENVTALMITKLKYDFAIQHVRLRNFNTITMYRKKLEWLKKINSLREHIDSLSEYIQKYTKLSENWTQSVEEFRAKIDNINLRMKAVERQFRSQYLNSIPQHLNPEINKLYKRRPKIAQKFLNSALICKELSTRVNSKTKVKLNFPLPKEVFEYLDGLNSLDEQSNMPANMEHKYWDQFVKLRRQKVEVELKLKGANIQLADGTAGMNLYNKEIGNLRNSKAEVTRELMECQQEYLQSVQNQALELRLSMGQVELGSLRSLRNLEKCILIHQDDINEINASIIKAGKMKIKAMQKVALFRRQVIYKEWEHKVVSANIEYLNNMIHVIGKCKVSAEFLQILRNWKKIKSNKFNILNETDYLNTLAEDRLVGVRKELKNLDEYILKMRQQVDEMKRSNKRTNRLIEQFRMKVAFAEASRDYVVEAKRKREHDEKMQKIKRQKNLIETVRRDYVHIMELKTILELQRLRTYPTLGPNLNHCST